MAADSGQKTEKPTPRRLREARKKGQIPRSVDLVQWVTLLMASFLLPKTLGNVVDSTSVGMDRMIAVAGSGETGPTLAEAARVSGTAALGLAPLFAFIVVSSIIGMAVQGGVVLTAHPLKPKWERVSPKAGFKRIFGIQSLVETGKALVRLVVLGILVSTTLFAASRDHILASGVGIQNSAGTLIEQVLLVFRIAALAGAVVGVADYAYQRWQATKKLKMSKQEVKQDQRSAEGDPMIRSRRRSAHAKLTRNQMLTAVNDARVVLVNPTHYAVALSYQGDGGAPVVVAKGTEELAWRIRERANLHDVPIIESPPLARALHASVEVGEAIPHEFFEAVAIVLAFVMRPRRNRAAATRRVSIPGSKLPPAPALSAPQPTS